MSQYFPSSYRGPGRESGLLVNSESRGRVTHPIARLDRSPTEANGCIRSQGRGVPNSVRVADDDDLTRRRCARPAPRRRASSRRVARSAPPGRRDDEMGDAPAPHRKEAAVDGWRFDALRRLAGGASTRRTTLRSAVSAAAASTIALVGLSALSGESSADVSKRRLRRCKRRSRCTPRDAGQLCTTSEQCCANTTNRICAFGPGSGSSTICCGGTAAPCSTNANCCRHYSCVSGVCRM
jgi:hypothetical protein